MTHLLHRMAAAAALVLLATGLQASTAQWRQAVLFEVGLGPTNPLIIFGFNPQPEPPPLIPFEIKQSRTEVSKTFRGIAEAQAFQYLIGVSMPGETVVLDDPGIAGSFRRHTVFADVGADTLTIELGFGASNGFGGIDAVAFNPQPEPPAIFGPGFETSGKDFGFGPGGPFRNIAQALEFDATMTLRVLDGQGNPLTLQRIALPVPLPAALPLLAAGLGGLLVLRRRR